MSQVGARIGLGLPMTVVRHPPAEGQHEQNGARNGSVTPTASLAQTFGELLPDLGHLGTNHYLAVHAARVILVELTVLWLSLVECLEFGDLRDYGAGQIP